MLIRIRDNSINARIKVIEGEDSNKLYVSYDSHDWRGLHNTTSLKGDYKMILVLSMLLNESNEI